MKRINIPGTSLMPSQICLGGGPLCNPGWIDGIFDIIDRYVDAGGNFIDTAAVYGTWEYDHEPSGEIILGKWYKSRQAHNKMIVTTKGAHPSLDTMNIPRMSVAELRCDLENSLRNLQCETIDLYWLHRDDETTSAGEIIERLNGFIKEGKIRYLGASNWSEKRIFEANSYAKAHGLVGFCANQPMWSLAKAKKELCADQTLQCMDNEMLKYHKESGLAAVPYSSQAGGYFQKLHDGIEIPPHHAHYKLKENEDTYPILKKLAEEKGASVNQVALAYLLHNSFPVFPIVGCYLKEKLYDSLGATEVKLTAEEFKILSKDKWDI